MGFKKVAVEKDDGRVYHFDRDDQKNDRFGSEGVDGYTSPMKRAPEETKVDAMKTREDLKKGGIL